MPIKARTIQNKRHKVLHLSKFIDRVQGQDARGSKDFVMTMADAKLLHADITRLLMELHNLKQKEENTPTEPFVTVRMDGGSF
jgi:hypothetical protein